MRFAYPSLSVLHKKRLTCIDGKRLVADCRRTVRKAYGFPLTFPDVFPEAQPQEKEYALVVRGKAEPFRTVRRQAAIRYIMMVS